MQIENRKHGYVFVEAGVAIPVNAHVLCVVENSAHYNNTALFVMGDNNTLVSMIDLDKTYCLDDCKNTADNVYYFDDIVLTITHMRYHNMDKYGWESSGVITVEGFGDIEFEYCGDDSYNNVLGLEFIFNSEFGDYQVVNYDNNYIAIADRVGAITEYKITSIVYEESELSEMLVF